MIQPPPGFGGAFTGGPDMLKLFLKFIRTCAVVLIAAQCVALVASLLTHPAWATVQQHFTAAGLETGFIYAIFYIIMLIMGDADSVSLRPGTAQDTSINPANGLPMCPGSAIDVHGNTYGTDHTSSFHQDF